LCTKLVFSQETLLSCEVDSGSASQTPTIYEARRFIIIKQWFSVVCIMHFVRRIPNFRRKTSGLIFSQKIETTGCFELRCLSTKVDAGLLSRMCALFKAYSGELAWKVIRDRLQRPHYLSRVHHERKIRSRRQSSDVGKYSFVNRTIQHWNQLPAEVLRNLPCKPVTFKKRVRKVIIELNKR